jgi:hypothetical protein
MSIPGSGYSQSTTGRADSAMSQNANYQVAQQTYGDVIMQLQNGGYRIEEVKRTFLGRIRILARNKVHLREVIVSRSTGEVKRDVVIEVMASGNDGQGSSSSPNSGSSGGATSGGSSSGGSSGDGSSGSSSGANASVSGGGFNAGASVGGGGVDVGVSGGGFGGGLGIGK